MCDRPRDTCHGLPSPSLGAPAMVSLLPHFCRTAPGRVSLAVSSCAAPNGAGVGRAATKGGTCFFPKPSFGLLLVRGRIGSCPGCGGASAKIQGINSCRAAPRCSPVPLAGGAAGQRWWAGLSALGKTVLREGEEATCLPGQVQSPPWPGSAAWAAPCRREPSVR